MSLYLALAVWVVLSFLASPVIGAIICRQFPHNQNLLGRDQDSILAILREPRFVRRVDAQGRRSAIPVRVSHRLVRPYGLPGRAIRPQLH
jgi:hypothetical protein